MNKKIIKISVNSNEEQYEFESNLEINKDILKFNNNNDSYIFDRKIKRLTKITKDTTITIDFLKKLITIIVDKKELNTKLDLKSKIDKDNYICYKYKVEDNNIKFEMEIKEV